MLVLASGLAFGGLGIAWYAFVREPFIPERAANAAPGVYAFLRDKWRIDELYDATVVRLVFAAADAGARFFDPRSSTAPSTASRRRSGALRRLAPGPDGQSAALCAVVRRRRTRAARLVRGALMPIVTVTIFAPLIGGILLALLPREHQRGIERAALAFGLVPFVLSLLMLVEFQPGEAGFPRGLEERIPWIPSWGISYHVGVDGISLFLVLLTTFLTPLVILASWGEVKRAKEYFVLFLFLETGMLGALVALDIFLFYVFWEVMLIPMYLLIGVWGGRGASTPRRSSCSTRWSAASRCSSPSSTARGARRRAAAA
jgi:NADH:ubiquinone oxidoreductase subunit 5 (subunit L)/multisubunit Na+/H+ antiporter MnhA subunit